MGGRTTYAVTGDDEEAVLVGEFDRLAHVRLRDEAQAVLLHEVVAQSSAHGQACEEGGKGSTLSFAISWTEQAQARGIAR